MTPLPNQPGATLPSSAILASPDYAAPGGSINPNVTTATLEIRLTIPLGKTKQSASTYVSPSTLSFYAQLKGKVTVAATFATAKGSAGCVDSTASRLCVMKVSAPPGKYAAFFGGYNLAPVKGKIPAGAHVLMQVSDSFYTLPTGTSVLEQSLQGVPAIIAISGIPKGTAGTSMTAKNFSIVVKDAGGNVITGPFANAVTVTDSDKSANYGSGLVTFNAPPQHSVM